MNNGGRALMLLRKSCGKLSVLEKQTMSGHRLTRHLLKNVMLDMQEAIDLLSDQEELRTKHQKKKESSTEKINAKSFLKCSNDMFQRLTDDRWAYERN